MSPRELKYQRFLKREAEYKRNHHKIVTDELMIKFSRKDNTVVVRDLVSVKIWENEINRLFAKMEFEKTPAMPITARPKENINLPYFDPTGYSDDEIIERVKKLLVFS